MRLPQRTSPMRSLPRRLFACLGVALACNAGDAPPPVDGLERALLADSLTTQPLATDSLSLDDDVDRSVICRGIDNSLECAQAVERVRLGVPNAMARRDGERLLIRLTGGETLALTNAPDSADVAGASYSYVGHLQPIAHHLIEVQYYEGRSFLLINQRTGRRTVIAGQPSISPDSLRIVTTSVDLEAGYDPTEIAVWRVDGDSLVLEWRLDPRTVVAHPDSAWGPTDAAWITATEIRVNKEHRFGRRGGTAVVRLGGSGWVLSDGG
jgi:hypothetical protein